MSNRHLLHEEMDQSAGNVSIGRDLPLFVGGESYCITVVPSTFNISINSGVNSSSTTAVLEYNVRHLSFWARLEIIRKSGCVLP